MKRKKTFLVLALLAGAMNIGAQTPERSFYIDYGQNNVANQGYKTEGADANGHYWNNIHGKGTGALHDEIQKYLKTVPGVLSATDEDIRHGGSGVTVVTFE